MSRKIRQINKAKASRPKHSTGRATVPGRREGIEGDIRVRQTDTGPVIEAKLGNKWYSAALTDVNEVPSIVKKVEVISAKIDILEDEVL